jgi:hypothetical protein
LQQHLKSGGTTTVAALKNEPAFKSLADHTGFQALLAEHQAIETAIKENSECNKRALALLQKGDHAGAVAEVKPILVSKYANRIDYYNAACVFSLASAAVRKDEKILAEEQAKLGREYADRAMELLRRAVAKGYGQPADLKHMKTDTDLDALRQREDFQKLLKDLEAKASKTSDATPPTQAK